MKSLIIQEDVLFIEDKFGGGMSATGIFFNEMGNSGAGDTDGIGYAMGCYNSGSEFGDFKTKNYN